jgi:hypothetical protein
VLDLGARERIARVDQRRRVDLGVPVLDGPLEYLPDPHTYLAHVHCEAGGVHDLQRVHQVLPLDAADVPIAEDRHQVHFNARLAFVR